MYSDDFSKHEGNARLRRYLMVVPLGLTLGLVCVWGLPVIGRRLSTHFTRPTHSGEAIDLIIQKSQGYVEQRASHLDLLCRQSANTADASRKAALDKEIIDEAGTVNNSLLPQNVQDCIISIAPHHP